jgi:phosphate transport system substrate-binding protein
MNQMNGNAQIVEAVKQDSSGIGYVGIGYVQGATGIVPLEVASRAGAEYYDPLNTEHVRTGRYPITRPLNQYLAGIPQGDIKDFIAFELSPAGQKIVEEEGFLPLNEEYVQYNKMTITE